jgi:hypothetical protein
MSESERLRHEAELTLEAADQITLAPDKQALLAWAQELRTRADRLDRESAKGRPNLPWEERALGVFPQGAAFSPPALRASFRV